MSPQLRPCCIRVELFRCKRPLSRWVPLWDEVENLVAIYGAVPASLWLQHLWMVIRQRIAKLFHVRFLFKVASKDKGTRVCKLQHYRLIFCREINAVDDLSYRE